MQPTRIAAVRYLNTAPLIEGLDVLSGVSLLPSVPSAIVGMIERGEADIGLASIVDCVAGQRPLVLLPVGMIGCDGPTMTVRLYSKVPFDRTKILHADTDSHTSVILARVLLKRLYSVRPEVQPLDTKSIGGAEAPETLLLIGDKVVTSPPEAVRYPHELDLGAAWKELTGLPFVYAMWMCREEDARSPGIQTATVVLERQRLHNRSRIDWLTQHRTSTTRWPLDVAQTYLGGLLRYAVGEREREAVVEFLGMAAEDGLLPARVPQWATPLG